MAFPREAFPRRAPGGIGNWSELFNSDLGGEILSYLPDFHQQRALGDPPGTRRRINFFKLTGARPHYSLKYKKSLYRYPKTSRKSKQFRQHYFGQLDSLNRFNRRTVHTPPQYHLRRGFNRLKFRAR